MNILIIGASGYIGGYLYTYFKSRNHAVIGTCQSNGGKYLKQFQILRDRIDDVDMLFEKQGEKYALICAGIANLDRCKKEYRKAYEVNVNATIRLIQKLQELNYRIVFFSSDQVFDGKKGNYTEKEQTCPVNAYGTMKAEVERFLLRDVKNACIIRLSKVIGLRDAKNDMFRGWKEQAEHGKVISCIKDYFFNPVYVADVAGCLQLLLEKQATGIFHLCGNERYSRKELCTLFCSALDVYPKIIEKDLDDFEFSDKRPLDVSMSNGKIVKSMQYAFCDFNTVFQRYKK